MSTPQGPTVRRRIVASELRRLRANGDFKQQDVASELGIAPNTLSRYEGCVSSMPVHVADKLFRFYGVGDDQLESLLELVRGSRKRGWLKGFSGIIPEWLEGLVALERDASKLFELAIHAVAGLLQTEDYARAILQSGAHRSRFEDHLRVRMKRAEIFQKSDAPEYWAVICESALRCQVGGPAVMHDQLRHLIELTNHPKITLQVLPNSHGAHPSMTTPYTLLRFDIAPHYGVVYLDYLTGSLYRDEPDEVEQYDSAYRHLIKSALPEAASKTLLATIAEEYRQ